MSVKEVADALSMDIVAAQYHFDLLLKNNLIIQTGIDSTSFRSLENAPSFELTLTGREYVVKGILK
jgi:hypothetical protein